MWKAIKWTTACLVVALVIALAGVGGYAIGDKGGSSNVSTAPAESGSQGYGILDEISAILQTDFVNPAALDPKVQRKGAIDGVIASLGDPHPVYISPEDLA